MKKVKSPVPGDPRRRLTMEELREALLTWGQNEPVFLKEKAYNEMLDDTLLKRFGDGTKLLDEVSELLEKLAKTTRDKKSTVEVERGIKKIDMALGAMLHGPFYANTGWSVPPPILWPNPEKRVKNRRSKGKK